MPLTSRFNQPLKAMFCPSMQLNSKVTQFKALPGTDVTEVKVLKPAFAARFTPGLVHQHGPLGSTDGANRILSFPKTGLTGLQDCKTGPVAFLKRIPENIGEHGKPLFGFVGPCLS